MGLKCALCAHKWPSVQEHPPKKHLVPKIGVLDPCLMVLWNPWWECLSSNQATTPTGPQMEQGSIGMQGPWTNGPAKKMDGKVLQEICLGVDMR